MNEFKEYSIKVKAGSQESYLKGLRKIVEEPNSKISIETLIRVESAFKPILNELHAKIEELENNVELLKKQIK